MIKKYIIVIIPFMLFTISSATLKAQVAVKNWAAYGGFGWDSTMVGKPIKPFSMVTFDGIKLESYKLKRKVIVLDFWATWCAPCRKLTPELDSTFKTLLHARFSDDRGKLP